MSSKKQSDKIYNKTFKNLEDQQDSSLGKKSGVSFGENNKNSKNTALSDGKNTSDGSGFGDIMGLDRTQNFQQANKRSTTFSPANDLDSNNIALALKSIGKDCFHKALRSATILSLIWFVCGLGFILRFYLNSSASSLFEFAIQSETMIVFLVAEIVPIILFFAFFIMLSRARDMQDATKSMAEIALRLMEPEAHTSERVLSVGHAVRQEISAMTEGVERTISRANELKDIVRSEVNALERSCTENEERMLDLVKKMGEERETIFDQAIQLRASISEVHESLKEELSLTSEEISIHLSTTTESFASIVSTRITRLTDKTNQAIQALTEMMSSKTDKLLQVLDSTSVLVTEDFDDRIEFLSKSFEETGRNFLNHFSAHTSELGSNTGKLNTMLEEQAQKFVQTFTLQMRQIADFFSEKENSVKVALNDMLNDLCVSFEAKENSFRKNIQATTENTISDVDLRTGLFEDKIKQFLEEVSETFDKRIAEFGSSFEGNFGGLESRLQRSLDGISGCLSSSRDNIENLLVSNIQTIDSTLEQKNLALADTLSDGQKEIAYMADESSEKLEKTLQNSIGKLEKILEEKCQWIDSDIGKKSTEISSAFDDSCQKMSNLIFDREESFSHSLLQAQLKFEETISDRPQSIIDSMSTNIKQLTEAIYDKTMVLAIALSESQKSLDDTLETHTNNVVNKITSAESRLATCFSESSDNICLTYKDSNKNLEEILQKHLTYLTDMLNSKSDHVDGIFGSSAERIGALISNNAKHIEEILSSGSADIDLELLKSAKTLGSIVDNIKIISASLETRCKEMSHELVGHSGTILSSLETAQETLRETFSQRNESFMNSLSENQLRFENNLMTHSQHVIESLSQDIQQLTEIAYEKAMKLASSLSKSQQHLDKTLDSHSQVVLEKISNADAKIAKVFGERVSNIRSAYAENHQVLDKKLSDHVSVLREVLSGGGEKIDSVVKSASHLVKGLLDENLSRIENLLSGGNDSMNDTLLCAHKKIDALLQEKAHDLENILDKRATSISRTVSENTAFLESSLKEKENSFCQNIDSSIVSFGSLSENIQTLTNKLVSLVADVSQSAIDISDKLETSVDNVSQKIYSSKDYFGKNISDFEKNIALLINEVSRIVEMSEKKISQTTHEVSQELLQTSDVVTDKIVERASRISGEIDLVARKFFETDQSLEKREESFRSILDRFNNKLAGILLEVDQTVSSRTEETRTIVTERIRDIRDVFSNVDQTLGSHGSTLVTKIKEYIKDFEYNLSAVKDLLEDRNETLKTSLDERSRTLSSLLSQSSKELSNTIVGAFHNEGSAVTEAIDKRICEAAHTLKKLEILLVDDVEKITSRISESNTDVATIINAATNSLTKVDERLHQTTNRITETTGQINSIFCESSNLFENKIKNLNKVSENTLSHMSEIFNKFDKNSEILLKSRDSLLKVQSETGLILDQRANNLNDLTSGLIIKSEEAKKLVVSLITDIKTILEKADFLSGKVIANIKNGLKTSLTGIDDVLSTVETRSRNTIDLIKNDLTYIEDKASKAIDASFETIEKKATDFSSDFLKKMHSSLPDIGHMFSNVEQKSGKTIQLFLDSLQNKVNLSIEKLADTSEEITIATEKMANELNSARSGLKRDSLHLVKEAKDGANTIRSTVQEQVNTLRNLKNLIADSLQADNISLNKNSKSLYEAQSRSAKPRLEETIKNNPSEEGWFNEILSSSAYNNTVESSSQNGKIASPSSLSIDSLIKDVSKFIDDNVFMSLWERYVQEEHDILSRRLYTLRGQKVFDNLQVEYETNIEFQRAVDCYISDFEEMLAEVSLSNPDPSVIQKHFVSDYGKVYTMLIHASGRTL